MLPKINKIENPGRPVVSSIRCHSANILKLIDCHLQSIEKIYPSYQQDLNDILNKADTPKSIPANFLLVAMDVKSVSAFCNFRISAVKAAYECYPEKSVATNVIIPVLAQILTLNNFMFHCKNYLPELYIYIYIYLEL